MITVATLLWSPNSASYSFSRGYDESWVERLYHGFARNLTQPFRFVCWTDRPRGFYEQIYQQQIEGRPDYASCIQPYKLNTPTILVGLDTIVTGNIDHLAEYCLTADKIAVPRDPFFPDTVCNGVALIPAGKRAEMYDAHAGENDMEWVREKWRAGQINVIDDLWPGQVCSYKGEIAKHGLGEDTRIVYFHGIPKADQLPHVGWIARHWHDVKVAA